MEKENLPDDEHDNKDEVGEESEEFHGDITEEEIENAEEIWPEELEDYEANEEHDSRTEYPEAPPMDELFDESDKKPDYDDEYDK